MNLSGHKSNEMCMTTSKLNFRIGCIFGTPSISLSLWPELLPVLLKFQIWRLYKDQKDRSLIKIRLDRSI